MRLRILDGFDLLHLEVVLPILQRRQLRTRLSVFLSNAFDVRLVVF